MEILPSLGRGSSDLLITDPPYGVKYRSNYREDSFDAIAGDADQDIAQAVISAVMELRIQCQGRHVYVFGPFDLGAIDSRIVAAANPLVWDKMKLGMGHLASPWAPSWEPIQFGNVWYSKAERSKGRGGLVARLRQSSVLRVPRPQQTGPRRHPTEKPVQLLTQLVESSSLVGETVLDPFAGAGSTLVSAVLSGRKAVGIELVAQYAEIAADRLEEAEVLADKMELI